MIAWLSIAVALAGRGTESDYASCLRLAAGQPGVHGTPHVQHLGPPLDQARNVAVVVGVPCHRLGKFRPLKWTTKDAMLMADALQAADFSVVLLTTAVDKAQFVSALERAEGAVDPTGTLLVYFSGHGALDLGPDDQPARHLVFSDTDKDAVATTALPTAWLESRLSSGDAARRVLVVDSCFAGEPSPLGKSSAGPAEIALMKGVRFREPSLARGDLRLYAARDHEQALLDPDEGVSTYTHYLLDALDGSGDMDGDACVSLWEAHESARRATRARWNGNQNPVIRMATPDNTPLWETCPARAPNRAVIVRSSTPASWTVDVHPFDKRDAAVHMGPVEAGRYQVTVHAPSPRGDDHPAVKLASETLRLDAGTLYDPAQMVRRRRPMLALFAGYTWETPRIAPSSGAAVGAWWAPRMPTMHGPALGLQAGFRPRGEVNDFGPLPAGDLIGRAAYLWRDGIAGRLDATWAVGPSLAGRALWRTPLRGIEWSFAPRVELHAHVSWRHVALLADVGLLLTSVDGTVTAIPSLQASLGWLR